MIISSDADGEPSRSLSIEKVSLDCHGVIELGRGIYSSGCYSFSEVGIGAGRDWEVG